MSYYKVRFRYTPTVRALVPEVQALLAALGAQVDVDAATHATAARMPQTPEWHRRRLSGARGAPAEPIDLGRVIILPGRSRTPDALVIGTGVLVAAGDERHARLLCTTLTAAGHRATLVTPEALPGSGYLWGVRVCPASHAADLPAMQADESRGLRAARVHGALGEGLEALLAAPEDEQAQLATVLVDRHNLTPDRIAALLTHQDRATRLLAVRAVPVLRPHARVQAGRPWQEAVRTSVRTMPADLLPLVRAQRQHWSAMTHLSATLAGRSLSVDRRVERAYEAARAALVGAMDRYPTATWEVVLSAAIDEVRHGASPLDASALRAQYATGGRLLHAAFGVLSSPGALDPLVEAMDRVRATHPGADTLTLAALALRASYAEGVWPMLALLARHALPWQPRTPLARVVQDAEATLAAHLAAHPLPTDPTASQADEPESPDAGPSETAPRP